MSGSKRFAEDGHPYTYANFMWWYGEEDGPIKWAQAEGAKEPFEKAESVASSWVEVDLPGDGAGAPQSGVGDGVGAPMPGAGVEEPGAQPSPPMTSALLDEAAIHDLRRRAPNSVNYNRMRSDARTDLNRMYHILQLSGALEPSELVPRFNWQYYVVFHPDAKALVGPGVAEFGAAMVKSTKDSNRSGVSRINFFIRHVDGGYWRLHPGKKRSDDAKPIYFPPVGKETQGGHEPQEDANPSDQWRRLPVGGFQYCHACSVPAIDRLGKNDAWAALKSLPEGLLDASPDAKFKWWLWLANLGKLTEIVLGCGVVTVSFWHKSDNVMHVHCTRADNTEVTVQLSSNGSHKLRTSVFPSAYAT